MKKWFSKSLIKNEKLIENSSNKFIEKTKILIKHLMIVLIILMKRILIAILIIYIECFFNIIVFKIKYYQIIKFD